MKPILFNSDMVRAILDGRKTVTRRVVKPQPPNAHDILDFDEEDNSFDFLCGMITDNRCIDFAYTVKAPYRPGDILYVRETFCRQPSKEYPFVYKASVETPVAWQWCPSIHMPLEAARIFLRVTEVRAERLQDITEDQAQAEGVKGWMIATDRDWDKNPNHRIAFLHVWNQTIKKGDFALYSWDANPWVWVIEFERISREEARQCL